MHIFIKKFAQNRKQDLHSIQVRTSSKSLWNRNYLFLRFTHWEEGRKAHWRCLQSSPTHWERVRLLSGTGLSNQTNEWQQMQAKVKPRTAMSQFSATEGWQEMRPVPVKASAWEETGLAVGRVGVASQAAGGGGRARTPLGGGKRLAREWGPMWERPGMVCEALFPYSLWRQHSLTDSLNN